MLRWIKMRFALGCHCWLLLITLLFVLLLFFQFFGQQSLRPSPCRPLQPRIELLTDEDERRYEAWKHEQVKRKERVKKFCEKETSWKETWLSNPNLHPLMFQYNKDYSLMGCLQPKVFPFSVKINIVSLRLGRVNHMAPTFLLSGVRDNPRRTQTAST